MALKNLLVAAAFFTAGFAAPLDVPQEGHLVERQSCSSQWGQCGGQGWTGPTCCQAGSTCVRQHDFYSQCLPGAGPTSSTTTTTTRTTSTAAGPTSTTTRRVTTTTTGGSVVTTTKPPNPGGTATYSGNPFTGVNLWANEYYSSEIHTLAIPQLSGAMATAAAKVAEVPSFQWIDTFAKIPRIQDTLADIRAANKAGGNYAGQFVVYDLPDRDCAAAASNGEYSIIDGGEEKYKNYINTIRDVLINYSDIRILLVIEPDSLANLVTNLNVPKCRNAQEVYIRSTIYAVKQLNLPNVAMYLDGGHAGWLGWPANQPGAASVFSNIYTQSGKPKALRGLATNVSNYNGFNLASAPPYTSPNPVYDEKKFVNALGPQLESAGWTGVKFIVDQGRSGKQPTGQLEWGHWCNAIGTGFGPRPSTNTGDAWVDAFVWVKPGGEADGTSDTTADRYDHNCGLPDALKPAPEAGTWFQAYFVQLLQNANPSFL